MQRKNQILWIRDNCWRKRIFRLAQHVNGVSGECDGAGSYRCVVNGQIKREGGKEEEREREREAKTSGQCLM